MPHRSVLERSTATYRFSFCCCPAPHVGVLIHVQKHRGWSSEIEAQNAEVGFQSQFCSPVRLNLPSVQRVNALFRPDGAAFESVLKSIQRTCASMPQTHFFCVVLYSVASSRNFAAKFLFVETRANTKMVWCLTQTAGT